MSVSVRLSNVSPLPYLNKCSVAAEMGDRARAKWAKKRGSCCAPFHEGELGHHLTQCGLG